MTTVKFSIDKRVYAICAGLFVTAMVLVLFDKPFSNWLHATMRPWDYWLQRITWFGDGRMLLPLCAVWAVALRLMKRGSWIGPVLALPAFAVSGAVVQGLKILFARPRPYLESDARYQGTGLDLTTFHWFDTAADFGSFPSGHTTGVFSVVWALAVNTRSHAARAVLLAAGVTIAMSRVALAKHFLADVVAGLAVGVVGAQLVVDVYRARAGRISAKRA